jgi:hypothetical protein
MRVAFEVRQIPYMRRRAGAQRGTTAVQNMETQTRKQSTVAPGLYRSQGRVRAIISAICIAVIMALFRNKNAGVLPMSYAICSREDSFIHSVDEELPSPECIVISGKHIVDRGSLQHIRAFWGDKDTKGPATSSNPQAPKSGVKIYSLPSGHALYPGFSDSHAHVLGLQSVSIQARGCPDHPTRIWFVETAASIWVQIRRR